MEWFTLKEKLPPLYTYVLIYVDRPWIDKDDDPKYIVAKFAEKYRIKGGEKFFSDFGSNNYSLNEVKYWSYIDKIKQKK